MQLLLLTSSGISSAYPLYRVKIENFIGLSSLNVEIQSVTGKDLPVNFFGVYLEIDKLKVDVETLSTLPTIEYQPSHSSISNTVIHQHEARIKIA